VDGEVNGTARGRPESTDDRRTSLALGLLLLATDEVRVILDTARKELQPAAERQTAAGAPGDGGPLPSLRPLIGAVFDVQRRVVLVGARLGRPWWRGAEQTMLWVWQAPPLAGARARVEAEAARLARSGAEHEARARRLASATVAVAIHRVTDALLDQEFEDAYQRAIARMLETPEIAELVREQSAGLAQELATSVRDRAVTGDDLVERLVRRVLRRPHPDGSGAPAPLPRVDGIEAEA
jgi:hypothetical protein